MPSALLLKASQCCIASEAITTLPIRKLAVTVLENNANGLRSIIIRVAEPRRKFHQVKAAHTSMIDASGYPFALWRSKFLRFSEPTIVNAADPGVCVRKRTLGRRVVTEICVGVDVGIGETSFSSLKDEIYECIELILCERLDHLPPHYILGCRKVPLEKSFPFATAYGFP